LANTKVGSAPAWFTQSAGSLHLRWWAAHRLFELDDLATTPTSCHAGANGKADDVCTATGTPKTLLSEADLLESAASVS
jgi:hypothetical protein